MTDDQAMTDDNRPIAVGDSVRWTSPMDPRAWADGVVTYSAGHDAAFDIEVTAVGDWSGRASDPQIGQTVTVARHCLRRILVSTCDVCCIPGATAETGRCSRGRAEPGDVLRGRAP